jgi:hypothetical protein
VFVKVVILNLFTLVEQKIIVVMVVDVVEVELGKVIISAITLFVSIISVQKAVRTVSYMV